MHRSLDLTDINLKRYDYIFPWCHTIPTFYQGIYEYRYKDTFLNDENISKRNLIVFHGKRIFDYDNDKIRYWIKIFHNFLQKSDM